MIEIGILHIVSTRLSENSLKFPSKVKCLRIVGPLANNKKHRLETRKQLVEPFSFPIRNIVFIFSILRE